MIKEDVEDLHVSFNIELFSKKLERVKIKWAHIAILTEFSLHFYKEWVFNNIFHTQFSIPQGYGVIFHTPAGLEKTKINS